MNCLCIPLPSSIYFPPPPNPHPPTKKRKKRKRKKKIVRSFTARYPCSGFHHCEHRSRSPNERTHSLFIPLPLSIKTNRAFVRSLPSTHTAGSTLVNTTHVHRTNELFIYAITQKELNRAYVHCQERIQRVPHL